MKKIYYEELNYQQVKQLLKVIQNKKNKVTIDKKLIEIELNSLNRQINEINELLDNSYFDEGLGKWVGADEDIVIFQDEAQDIMNSSFENKFGTANSLITGLMKYKIRNKISKKTNLGEK